MQEKMNQDVTEELRQSFDKLGPIYPVLVDKNGKTIDGFHRLLANPDWPKHKVDSEDEVKNQIIGLVSNINRRHITAVEITKRLDMIAKLTKWKPQKIAEEVGMSHNWVLKYISDEYKHLDKVQGAVTRRVTDEIPFDSDNLIKNTSDTPDTMTQEEQNDMEDTERRRVMIILPPDIHRKLEENASKRMIDLRVMVLDIVREWLNRRR